MSRLWESLEKLTSFDPGIVYCQYCICKTRKIRKSQNMEIVCVPAVYYTFEKGELYSFKKRYTVDNLGNIRGRSEKVLKPRDIKFLFKYPNNT